MRRKDLGLRLVNFTWTKRCEDEILDLVKSTSYGWEDETIELFISSIGPRRDEKMRRKDSHLCLVNFNWMTICEDKILDLV